MNRKIILLVLVCFLSLIINGCVVRTYKVTKQRQDQDLSSGNRGQIFGERQVTEEEPRKATRQLQVIELELPTKAKKGVASTPAEPEVSGPESVAEEVVEAAEEPIVVVGPAESSTLTTMEKYTVRKGDTLQKISKKFYGTTKRWKEIYQANQKVLKGPDKVFPGQVIEIPVEEVIGTK